jgi:hypothetical protein
MLGRVSLVLLLVMGRSAAQNTDCGTSAIERIAFEGPGGDYFPVEETEAVSLQTNGTLSSIRVSKTRYKKDGTQKGIDTFLSVDSGRTWKPTKTFIPTEIRTIDYDVKEVRSRDPKVLYRETEQGLFRSEDGANTWVATKPTVDGLGLSEFADKSSGVKLSSVWTLLAAVHPSEAHTIFASFLGSASIGEGKAKSIPIPGLFVSRNGGENWTLFSRDLVLYDPQFLHPVLGISSSNPLVMVGHQIDGLVITRNGGKTWAPVGQQRELESPAYLGQEYEKDLERLKKLGIKPVENQSWKRLDVYQIEFQPRDDRTIVLGTSKGIYKSTDQGGTWRLLNLPFRTLYGTNSFVLNPDNPSEILVGSIRGAFLSRDGGCSFRHIYPAVRK